MNNEQFMKIFKANPLIAEDLTLFAIRSFDNSDNCIPNNFWKMIKKNQMDALEQTFCGKDKITEAINNGDLFTIGDGFCIGISNKEIGTLIFSYVDDGIFELKSRHL